MFSSKMTKMQTRLINQIDEETEEYVSIDDEDTLNKVFELFKKKYEGDINFE